MTGRTLRQIRVKNFKRFDEFTMTCSQANVLVGPNNSGKSTLLDALRVLYGALRYARRLKPKLINTDDGEVWGYSIPHTSIPIDLTNVTEDCNVSNAEIDFTHDNGTHLHILLHPSHHTQLYIPSISYTVNNGRKYFANFPIDIVIVPTLSPFETAEPYVLDETVVRIGTLQRCFLYRRGPQRRSL